MHRLTIAFICTALLAGCDGASSSGRSGQVAAPAQEAPERSLTLSGVVTQDGVPVERAALVVSSLETGLVPEEFDPASMFTDGRGAFRFELPADRYRVVAVGPDRAEATLELTLEAESRAVELALPPAAEAERAFVEQGPRFERSEEIGANQ